MGIFPTRSSFNVTTGRIRPSGYFVVSGLDPFVRGFAADENLRGPSRVILGQKRPMRRPTLAVKPSMSLWVRTLDSPPPANR